VTNDSLARDGKKNTIASNFGVALCADGSEKSLSDVMVGTGAMLSQEGMLNGWR